MWRPVQFVTWYLLVPDAVFMTFQRHEKKLKPPKKNNCLNDGLSHIIMAITRLVSFLFENHVPKVTPKSRTDGLTETRLLRPDLVLAST